MAKAKKSGVPHGGVKRKAPKGVKDLDLEGAAKAVKEGPEAMAEFAGRDNAERAEQAAERVRETQKRVRESGFTDKAREVPTGDLMKGIQDVAISTRIAIDHASKAVSYAEVTLRNEADAQMGKVSKEAKRRIKEVEKAEAKLGKAIEMLRKVRNDLDTTLRGARK